VAQLSPLLEGYGDHEQVTYDGLHPDGDLKSGILEYKVDLLYNRHNTKRVWTRKEVFSVQCSVFSLSLSEMSL